QTHLAGAQRAVVAGGRMGKRGQARGVAGSGPPADDRIVGLGDATIIGGAASGEKCTAKEHQSASLHATSLGLGSAARAISEGPTVDAGRGVHKDPRVAVTAAAERTYRTLVRIALRKGRGADFAARVGTVVYETMMATIDVPRDDNFQVITEHEDKGLIYDPTYLGVARSDGIIFIQITLRHGRTPDAKRALYRTLA